MKVHPMLGWLKSLGATPAGEKHQGLPSGPVVQERASFQQRLMAALNPVELPSAADAHSAVTPQTAPVSQGGPARPSLVPLQLAAPTGAHGHVSLHEAHPVKFAPADAPDSAERPAPVEASESRPARPRPQLKPGVTSVAPGPFTTVAPLMLTPPLAHRPQGESAPKNDHPAHAQVLARVSLKRVAVTPPTVTQALKREDPVAGPPDTAHPRPAHSPDKQPAVFSLPLPPVRSELPAVHTAEPLVQVAQVVPVAAQHDASFRLSVMPQVAHVQISDTPNAELSLRMRLNAGVADVQFTGPAAEALESRRDELHLALVNEGLQLKPVASPSSLEVNGVTQAAVQHREVPVVSGVPEARGAPPDASLQFGAYQHSGHSAHQPPRAPDEPWAPRAAPVTPKAAASEESNSRRTHEGAIHVTV